MAVIGFSTGAIALDDFATALQLLAPTRAKAVELSALRAAELPALLAALPVRLVELRHRYEYISFHAPTNFNQENDLVDQLKIIADMGLNIVVHPDTIHDTSAWRSLGARLCIENMDSRKPTGRTADELQHYFDQLPEARLCFDVAHARQVDSSMTEAVRILQRFDDRLAQVHISEVNSKGRHFAMSFAAKRAYEPLAARLSRVPVIIESMVEREEIVHEISETEKVLNFERRLTVHGSITAGRMVGSVHRPE
ncbi:hypothetical protein [Mesorhizobium temperatum]|uniref:Xylose isomerase-like TIM barrel domain-containing protein n=1 Tax=Mesorhizobium temperatum TaxID=241416 RepID=A0A271L8Q6_9HYPH|nr:hypothetical protein [Mesorhizobium temperatum]PAQ04482.1 hypothetical protein CIT26_35310 [Mesorhizobium temperatum]